MISAVTTSSLLLVLLSLPQSDGFCPLACECNEVALSVSCARSELEVLPITLNPGIQRLQLQNNNIRAVDAALGFYAQLQYIDLSHNQLIRSDHATPPQFEIILVLNQAFQFAGPRVHPAEEADRAEAVQQQDIPSDELHL